MAAAAVTTTLRLGSLVFGNDFRHPVVLAREAATIDLLSEGRLEFGLGTGWEKDDYERTGMPLDPPGTRVGRFEEAVQLIKKLFGDEPVTFSGQYYAVSGLNGLPKPAQRPHPPILIGGGSRRMLSLAVREATIVSVNTRTTASGDVDWSSNTAAATDRKVKWVQQMAGDRFGDLELNILVLAAIVTDRPRESAERLAQQWGITPDQISLDDLLASPHFLFGSDDEIVETLQMRRDRYGISYVTVSEEESMDSFAPIVARLSGT
jgi:probable F420-dependent oxidoreductase